MLSPCIVDIDHNYHEQLQHGTAAFPFACYHDDLSLSQVPWHWHEELEAAIVTEGSIHLVLGGEQMRVDTGEGFFINTGVLHSCYALTPERCRLHSMVFHARLVSGGPESVFHQKYIRPITGNPRFQGILLRRDAAWQADTLRLFEEGWQACAGEDAHFELKVRYAVSSALAGIAEHMDTLPFDISSRSLRDSERIKAMLQFITENYGEKIDTTAIARSASVSESQCMRCFRATLGTTPIRLLREYRVEQAANQLARSLDPIADIAARCGFQDISYFTKTFRELKGCTPKEYRIRNHSDKDPTGG